MLSSPRFVTIGVPQDSVLGLLFFFLYISHVVCGSSCRFKIFADDVKLYLSHVNILPPIDDVSVLQRDIDLLVAT